MIGILSIDFDYFIDVSAEERDLYFPKGSDEIPKEKLKIIWEERYSQHPRLRKIGVIQDYYFVQEFLTSLNIPKDRFYMADSHKSIRNLIAKIPHNLPLKIVNIDFHHDYYHFYSGGDAYNCGNWLRRLVEERPTTKVKWIRRKDSQIYSLEGEFPFEHVTDIRSLLKDKFDYLFICRSPEWSPPHLSGKYEELAWSAMKGKTA